MTNEEIKQNAIAYEQEHENQPLAYRYSYIAGAHSRDEEIRQLHDVINDYSETIEKLRNPWISVEERLPEKAKGLYGLEKDERHKMVLFKTANGRLFKGYLDAEEIWRASTVPYTGACPIDSLTWLKVTHWMPIPTIQTQNNKE